MPLKPSLAYPSTLRSCDATVETALLNVAGVTDADAVHETQTVQVECADTVTAEQLAAAVEGAGEKFHALSVTAA